jgi:glycosyltransferase involved in cell wall biosynthesis
LTIALIWPAKIASSGEKWILFWLRRDLLTSYPYSLSPQAEKTTVLLVSNLARTVYQHRRPLLSALRAAGFRVIVAAPPDAAAQSALLSAGAEYQPLQHFQRNSKSPWQQVRALLELRCVFHRCKPDLAMPIGVQAIVLSNLAGAGGSVRSVSLLTGLGYAFLHRSSLAAATRLLLRIALQLADTVVFENPDDLRRMRDRRWVRAGKTALVAGSGVDLDHFLPQPEAATPTNKTVFTFIGRLLYDKGLREFAEAAIQVKKQDPNTIFRIAGPPDPANPANIRETDWHDWLRSGALEYAGAVEDVRPLIAASDWVVLPSYREGVPRALLEAMAMEKPLITTHAAGCRETVEEGKNGFLTPVGHAGALAAVFVRCLQITPETRRAMGRHSRKIAAESFETGAVNANLIAILKKVARRNCFEAVSNRCDCRKSPKFLPLESLKRE